MRRDMLTDSVSVPQPVRFVDNPLTLADILDLEANNLRDPGCFSSAKRIETVTSMLHVVAERKLGLQLQGAAVPRFAVLDIDRAPGKIFDTVLLFDAVLDQ